MRHEEDHVDDRTCVTVTARVRRARGWKTFGSVKLHLRFDGLVREDLHPVLNTFDLGPSAGSTVA